ncbi:unnamed protein product [Calypogeia fissa]
MPKLPEFIFDSHKQYKADTNQFTSWLVETAEGLGYDLDLQPVSVIEDDPPRKNPPHRSGRTKGKARKQQGSKGGSAPKSPAAGSSSFIAEYKRIFVKEFTKIANFIAGSANKVKVPNLVLNLARRAIAMRKRCAEWFKQQAPEDEDDISAKTHQHFITVLEEVVEILDPLCERDCKPTSKTKTSNVAETQNLTSQGETLVNPFSILDIEDTTDEDLSEEFPQPQVTTSSTTISTTKTTKRTSRGRQVEVHYILEEEESDADDLLALFCFFYDLYLIRDSLRDTWADYRDRTIDLITASVTTNMAFHIIRSKQDDLLAMYPELDNYKKLAIVLCVAGSMRRTVNHATMEVEIEVDFEDFLSMPRRKQVEEFVYIPIYSLFMSLLQVIQPNMLPVYQPGHFGTYNPRQSRDSMTTAQKELEDKIILAEVLPDFVSLARLKGNRPVQDELSKELQKMVCDKEISPLLVFAVQVYLDIHHVLREQVLNGFEDLRSAGVRIATSLQMRAQNTPKVPFVNWPASNERCVDMLNTFIKEWILKDYLGNIKQPVVNRMLPGVHIEAYFLLIRHPLFCGMLQFRLQLMFQDLGMTLATAWGTILFVSHLYEAGKHAGFLGQDSWKDMEWVMKVHDKERMFRGRVPQNVTESFKSLCLMAGASTSFASTFRANKKNNVRERPRLSPKGPSFLKENSPISAMFREDVVHGRVVLTAETMEDLLGDYGVDPSSLELYRPQTKLQQLYAQTHKLEPLVFLNAMKTALVAEQHMIRFDYVSLHMRCIQLLREIRVKLHDRFMKLYGEGYMENVTQLSWLVGWVLYTAVESNGAARLLMQPDGSLHSVMLEPASQVVEDLIRREGDVECTKLEKILPQAKRW